MGNNSVKLFRKWTSGSGDVVYRYFISRALVALCSVEHQLLCNFGRRHHEKQFSEIILNLDQWFRWKCHLKEFLIWSSSSPNVKRSRIFCAICVDGIMRNNSMK